MGRTHLASGVAVGLATTGVAGSGVGAGVVWLALAAVASVAPDLDYPRGMLARRLGPVGKVLSDLTIALSTRVFEATRSPGDQGDGGHRHLTHTPACGIAVGLLTGGVWAVLPGWVPLSPSTAGAAVTLGWLTHIAGDAVTISGCPLVWPVRVRGSRWYRPRIPYRWAVRTGGLVETFAVFPAFVAATVAQILL